MKILAIDPGNIESAYVVFDGKQILQKGKVINSEMKSLITTLDYDVFKIEMIASYGMAVGKSVFDTCVWIGIFINTFRIASIESVYVYRKDVKMHLCNSVKAKDANIRQALIDRFEPELHPKQRPKGILKGVSKDIWSALAVAVYCYDNHK